MNSSTMVTELRNKFADLEAIYLFGSRATGGHQDSSDWDLVFLRRNTVTEIELWEFKTDLEALYLIDLDLVDFYRAHIVFQNEIIKTGKVLWCRDRDALAWTEGLVTSFYLKLNEEGKEMLPSGSGQHHKSA